MKFRTKPTLEAIDALCQRECCFAICREAGANADDFYMSNSGNHRYHHISEIAEKSGFIQSEYSLGNSSSFLFIPEERDELPLADKFCPIHPRRFMKDLHPNLSRREHYSLNFHQYQELIRDTELKKLVLARSEDIATQNFSAAQGYARACELYPNAFCALVHQGREGTWICSTPELLIKGLGESWTSMSLAGTQACGEDWSEKNKQEQEWVSEHIRETLNGLQVPFREDSTCTLNAGDIEHLCTIFHMRMSPEMLSQFIDHFPPTPAVCGYPTDLARRYHRRYRDIHRSCYAGFLGPYNAAGPSAFYVTLRCMQVADDFCRLYAGGGILAESDEESEWQETCLKMQAMRTLIEEQQESR